MISQYMACCTASGPRIKSPCRSELRGRVDAKHCEVPRCPMDSDGASEQMGHGVPHTLSASKGARRASEHVGHGVPQTLSAPKGARRNGVIETGSAAVHHALQRERERERADDANTKFDRGHRLPNARKAPLRWPTFYNTPDQTLRRHGARPPRSAALAMCKGKHPSAARRCEPVWASWSLQREHTAPHKQLNPTWADASTHASQRSGLTTYFSLPRPKCSRPATLRRLASRAHLSLPLLATQVG